MSLQSNYSILWNGHRFRRAGHPRSAAKYIQEQLFIQEPRQILGVVSSDANDLAAQRHLHAAKTPDIVLPAAARKVMDAPAVDDAGASDFDAGDGIVDFFSIIGTYVAEWAFGGRIQRID